MLDESSNEGLLISQPAATAKCILEVEKCKGSTWFRTHWEWKYV